jgi:hypothetical protein
VRLVPCGVVTWPAWRIVGYTASDNALALIYPNGWRHIGRPAQAHFSDDALLAHLGKERSPQALRFRHWVEREIAFPAQRLRRHAGVARPGEARDSTPAA